MYEIVSISTVTREDNNLIKIAKAKCIEILGTR